MASEAPEMTATFSQIDELARWLFMKADSTNLWSAQDEMTRLYWRKEAARRLQESLRAKADSAR